jgi:hypothetical protein
MAKSVKTLIFLITVVPNYARWVTDEFAPKAVLVL